jgi:flagellar biosynthetic protein FliR
MLILAMAESLHTVPLMDFSIPTSVGRFVVTLLGKTFVMAIRIAAPILVALLLTNIALGIIARMVPQMNIFFLSMPVNLGIGLLILSLALPYLSWGMRQWLGHLGRDLFLLIRLLAGG